MTKALPVPIDETVDFIKNLPHTISYVIRKRQQIDGLSELPKEQRPPDEILWSEKSEDLTEWLDKVVYKKKEQTDSGLVISLDSVEK